MFVRPTKPSLVSQKDRDTGGLPWHHSKTYACTSLWNWSVDSCIASFFLGLKQFPPVSIKRKKQSKSSDLLCGLTTNYSYLHTENEKRSEVVKNEQIYIREGPSIASQGRSLGCALQMTVFALPFCAGRVGCRLPVAGSHRAEGDWPGCYKPKQRSQRSRQPHSFTT